MLMRISLRIRLSWCALITIIAVASLLPRDRFYVYVLFFARGFGNSWAHFFAYMGASCLPLLAWRFRLAFVICFGVTILSVGLELLHALVSGDAFDFYNAVTNILGVAAGVLLGLNLLMLHTEVADHSDSNVDRSRPRSL